MEIKTCEQYVLAQLEEAQNDREELADTLVEAMVLYGKIKTKYQLLSDFIREWAVIEDTKHPDIFYIDIGGIRVKEEKNAELYNLILQILGEKGNYGEE